MAYAAGLRAAKRGKEVSVRGGSWRFTLNGDFTYQWHACDTTRTSSCSDVSGETDKRYTPTALIVGKRLRVLVTYTSQTGDLLTAATAVSGVAVRESRGFHCTLDSRWGGANLAPPMSVF